jgi:hypothetical protein
MVVNCSATDSTTVLEQVGTPVRTVEVHGVIKAAY